MLGESLVVVPRGRVEDEEEDVEPREESSRQVDVFDRRYLGVVPAVQRVGRREDRGPGVERRRDAGLADRDGLLLHDLVDRRPVRLVHLVKLVDAADAVVGENERASLCNKEGQSRRQSRLPTGIEARRARGGQGRTEHKLVGDGVTHDGRSETDAGRSLASRVDAARGDLGDVLQQLRLCDSGVAHQADVDVTADLHAVADVLGDAADEEEQERLLDVLVAVDLWGDAARRKADEERQLPRD
jgi:hypothetical protein